MDTVLRIAIDGPSGSGKSTIAKIVADKLGLEYIDTGSMYRAIAFKVSKKIKEQNFTGENFHLDDFLNENISNILDDTDIDFKEGNVYLDGQLLGNEIRVDEISILASEIAQFENVRKKLVDFQREIASKNSVVMDGRDIATNVIKDAEVKIFLTASVEERAMRRYKQLLEQGQDLVYEEIYDDIKHRDINDKTRKLNPLRPAKDSKILDTTGLTIEEVVAIIENEVKLWQKSNRLGQ
ncbi:MAG: (d)CMP kinase [Eubacteriales bacterium]|nr:(d)CMP kinase [Eubacteriales bacterium]MDY3332780.1 (d)CMP kinase [Gallibacter sp.]